jgi:hypothetical protein
MGGSPEVDSEDLRQLCNTKRMNSYCEALQQAMSVILIHLIDIP